MAEHLAPHYPLSLIGVLISKAQRGGQSRVGEYADSNAHMTRISLVRWWRTGKPPYGQFALAVLGGMPVGCAIVDDCQAV